MRFVSSSHADIGEVSIHAIHTPQAADYASGKWWIYPFGACALADVGFDSGCDMSFFSTLPVGAGMSSSAALSVGTLYALLALHNKKFKPTALALKAQQVEWDFAGVHCGIMDQMAIIHGKKNHAVFLDTQDLSVKLIPIDTSAVRFIIVNSGEKHSLRESGYNDRRKESESALGLLHQSGFPIKHLCQLGISDLADIQAILPQTEYKRASHAISENHRVHQFSKEIQQYNLHKAGELLYKSHDSLSVFYEVSTPLIDDMVEWASEVDGVYGARLMGGGFGGCTINMVALYAVDHFKETIANKFNNAEKRLPEIYECSLSDGISQVLYHP